MAETGWDYEAQRQRKIRVDATGRLMIVGCAKLTELISLKQALFFRAETLGVDLTDGTGSVTHGQTASQEPYYTQLTTGNVLNDDVGSHLVQDIARADRHPADGEGGILVIECHARLEQTPLCILEMGFGAPGTPEIASPGASIFYNSSVGVNWQARSYQVAEEQTDTGVAADTDWHIFKIVITAADVTFYIDGTLVATHTVQIPNAGLVIVTNRIIIQMRTLAAAVKRARYSYFSIWNE